MPPQDVFSSEQRVLLFLLAAILTIGLAAVWGVRFQEPSQARVLVPSQAGQLKKMLRRVPKRVPVKIEVKNLDKETWVRDLALEVTNTSNKPIYFLEFWLVMPEVISENGRQVGIPLRYGRMEFVDFNTMARSDDVPIRPGETYSFKIPAQDREGWEKHKHDENRPDPVGFELLFVQLSFGDGTGFNGTDAEPYPYVRSGAFKGCREGSIQVGEDARNKPPTTLLTQMKPRIFRI